MLTSADLRHEEIGTVQIDSVSVLVFVVTKQKQNEVFFLSKKKKERKKKDVEKKKLNSWQGWTASRLESARRSQLLRAAIPRNRKLGRGRC